MNANPCADTYVELEALIEADPSRLCWKIAHDLAAYTIPFVVSYKGQMGSGATGTLVTFRDEHYILTAAHVWDVLRKGDAIRIPLQEGVRSRFAIAPVEFTPFVLRSGWWNQWGPDLALLQIPMDRVGSFVDAGRRFYNLSEKNEGHFKCGILIWFVLGAPAMRGQFSSEFAVPELQGMRVLPITDPYFATVLDEDLRPKFDFVDITVDITQPDVASNFDGVSGGGFWRVYVYKDTEGQIRAFKVLDGVAFWQSRRFTNLLLRCHGPQSLGELLRGVSETSP